METSPNSWSIELGSRLIGKLRRVDPKRRQSVEAALLGVEVAWGDAHRHRGAGIRKLGPQLFECRVGLDLRLIFVPDPARRTLVFVEMGTHDEIRRFLRRK